MLGESGKPEAALRFYRRALSLDPSLAVAHANAGKILFGPGNFAEALAAFEAATSLAPGDADAWNSRAGALRELGRLEELLEAARRALALAPRFRRSRDQSRQRAAEARPDGRGADGLSPGQAARPDFAAALCGEGAGAARPRALRRSAGRLRGGRGARQPRSGRRQGLPPADARRFRARLGGLRERAGWRASRWPRRWGRAFRPGRAGRPGRARAGPQRPRPRRYDPVRPLPASDGASRRRGDFRLPAEIASASVVRRSASALSRRSPDEPFDAQIAISSLPRAFGTRLDDGPGRRPYLRPEAALRRQWARADRRRRASRSGSSGRAIRIRRPTSGALDPARRPGAAGGDRRTCGSSRCKRAPARSSSANCRPACGSRRSARTSTPGPTPSSTPRRRWRISISSSPATPRSRISPARSAGRSGSR